MDHNFFMRVKNSVLEAVKFDQNVKATRKFQQGLVSSCIIWRAFCCCWFFLLFFFPLTLFFIYLSALNPLWNLTLKEVALSFAQSVIRIFVFSKYVTKNLLTEISSFCDVKACFFSVNPVYRRLWCKMLEWKIQMCSSVVLAFSSLARIMGECLTIHSLPML